MSRKLFAICLAVAALTGVANAQTVTIKIKTSPDVGKSAVYHETSSEATTKQVVEPTGNAMREDKTETVQEKVFTETILEKGAKGPTKWKRSFEKATRTMNGKTTARSFEGKTLVFEKKDGKVIISVEGDAKLDPKDLKELQQDEAREADDRLEAMLPNKAVKVGDKWAIDPKKQVENGSDGADGTPFDLEKSSAEGLLTKTYEKNGIRYGIIEVTMKLAMKEPRGFTFSTPAVMEVKLSIDAAIDGSTTTCTINHGAKISMTGTVGVEGQKSTLKLTMNSTGKVVCSAEK